MIKLTNRDFYPGVFIELNDWFLKLEFVLYTSWRTRLLHPHQHCSRLPLLEVLTPPPFLFISDFVKRRASKFILVSNTFDNYNWWKAVVWPKWVAAAGR